MKDWIKQEERKFFKGVPKKDGSGGGMRLNKGRGGCEETEEFGKGMNKQLKDMVLLGGGIILLSKAIDVLN